MREWWSYGWTKVWLIGRRVYIDYNYEQIPCRYFGDDLSGRQTFFETDPSLRDRVGVRTVEGL